MKTVTSMLVVLLFAAVGYAQMAGQLGGAYAARVERAHSGLETPVKQDGIDQLIKSAKVTQAAAAARLRELAQANPAHAADLESVVRMHERLGALLRNEQQKALDTFFYQNVLFQLEDLADAVRGIKDPKIVQACQEILDHGYYYAPKGARLVSLRVITDHVGEEISIFSGGFAKPEWGDFYQHLDGYSN